MKNLNIIPGNQNLKVLSYLTTEAEGLKEYRVITKCQAGFMISSVTKAESVIKAFRQYNVKAIQSIADAQGHTLFARNGKKIWASIAFLSQVTVGDINQDLFNTGLYNYSQYQAVGAKTWADLAYVNNN